MKKLYLKCLSTGVLLLLLVNLSQAQCWELVWEDNFDYTGLPDPAKWGYDTGGHGWGNNELQYYTSDREQNARVENGKLIITAIKEQYGNRQYTSTRLVSREKGDWLYGRVEVRAKLPTGKGTWPAIWMLPTDWEYGGWPDSGEIDIMEHVGYDQNRVHGTVHTKAFNHMRGTQVGKSKLIPTASTAFHLYAIEWYADRIDFFIDDDKYFTFHNQNKTFSEWPFDKRFHLIMNIAIGGDWGGAQGIDPNLTQAVMEVDYVKVYQKGEDMTIEGESSLLRNKPGAEFRAPYSDNFSYLWEVPEGVTIDGPDNEPSVKVNWGCNPGKIVCNITGECGTYKLEKEIAIADYKIKGPMFFNEGQELTFSTEHLLNTTYEWKVPEGVEILQGGDTNEVKVKWSDSRGTIELIIENDCEEAKVTHHLFPHGQWPYPSPDAPHVIPGSIKATDYDYGGQGVAYHDVNANNQGAGPRQNEGVDTEYADNGVPNIGWIENGEWVEYTVKVETAGVYSASIRTASAGNPDHLTILMNGEVKFGPVKVNSTGAWNSFKTLELGQARLEEGEYVMRYNFNKGGYNVGTITFAFITSLNKISAQDVLVYPNPSTGKLYVEGFNAVSEASVIDVSGRKRPVPFNLQDGQTIIVDINKLTRGVYVLELVNTNSILHTRVILK